MDKEKYFDGLVLSGGGSKGILTLGILHYYHEKGLYNHNYCKEYAGTSIGSVINLLLICEYTPMEIFSEIYSMYSFFSVSDCHNIWDVVKNMGLMSINTFASKIEELVTKKMGFVPTLGELKELTGKRLLVCGANTSHMTEEKYTPETHPKLGCIGAIKISCNLPLIFQRIKYKDSYVVDGGLMNNYPWDYLSEELTNVLGVVVSGSDYSLPDDTFIGYFYRLMVMPINTLTDMRCRLAPKKIHTIKTVWDGAPVLQLTMSSDLKMKMFLTGYHSAEKHEKSIMLTVKGWNSEEKDW